jgi:hypothetical protein
MDSQTCFGAVLLFLLSLQAGPRSSAQSKGDQSVKRSAAKICPVTLPRKAPIEAQTLFGACCAHWNGHLFVGGLWPNGNVVVRPNGPGSIEPDGSLSMKFGWYRGEGLHGKLTIQGRRLDASAPPLRASIADGYGDTGFQATGITFPTEGCWQVTGEVADTRVTFVARVIRGAD